MNSSYISSQIKVLQGAFSVISILNMQALLFPPDYTPQDGCCFDYVIVGGGISGSVVSARLVEAGFSVLVIEQGGIYGSESHYPGLVPFVKNSRVDRNYTVVDDGSGNCHKSSGLLIPEVLGGSGAIDFMIYSRGSPSDYNKWCEVTRDSSWAWPNMIKYFKKSENLKDQTILNSPFGKFHGTDGKINITRDPNDVCDVYLKGFKEAGEPVPLDNIGDGRRGYSRALFYIDDGKRVDAALSYLGPIKDNPKIHKSLNSLATKIIFDENKNAAGVQLVKNGRKITVRAKKEVIISAGAIKTPQILMLSGIGRKDELEKFNIPCISDLPVGENLQNSVGAFLVFKTNRPAVKKAFDAEAFNSPLIVGQGAVDKASIFAEYETLNFIIDDYKYFLTFCGYTLAFKNEICDRLYTQANKTQMLATVLLNSKVKSRGMISLKNTDPGDSPKIQLNYYTNDKDLDAIAAQIEDYMKVVSTPYFKRMGLELMEATNKCSFLTKDSREYWMCYALCMTAGTGRFVGTSSLGTVVDTRLRVKGVNKLRVVSSSVIPYTVSGPIFGAIVAMAEKAAEMITSDA